MLFGTGGVFTPCDEEMASQGPAAGSASARPTWQPGGAVGGWKGKVPNLGAPILPSRRVATWGSPRGYGLGNPNPNSRALP